MTPIHFADDPTVLVRTEDLKTANKEVNLFKLTASELFFNNGLSLKEQNQDI